MQSLENNGFTLNRRRFIELIGVSAASFGLIGAAGCSNASSPASGGAADTIIYGQGADPRSLDPAYFDDGESAKVGANIYEGLYQYGAKDTKVSPNLAQALPDISADGKVYTIKLHEGITFHDGTEFNADAVKASIERQLAPNRNANMAYATFLFGDESIGTGVEKIETPDKTTVVITLRTPSTPFVKNLAMAVGAPIVSPAAVAKAGQGNPIDPPVGTGPYQFVNWTKGTSVTLKAFDKYWNKDEAPKTENLIFKIIPENNTRVTALLNGECDIIDGIDLSSTDVITQGGYELFSEDGMNINYLAMNTQNGQTTDPDVRRAIAQSVNVDELVKAIYGSYATPANSVMPLFMAPYDKDIKQTSYDPDAAKQTFADKGITQLACITYSNPRSYNPKGGQVLAETIQGYLEKVGVKLNITTYDWTTYKTKVQTDPFEVCFYGWNGDNGDPDNFMNLLSDPDPAANVAHFKDADYNALIAKGLAEPDGANRDDIYKQCEEVVAQKQPWMLISHAKNLCGVSPKIENFYYHPTGVVFMKGVTKKA